MSAAATCGRNAVHRRSAARWSAGASDAATHRPGRGRISRPPFAGYTLIEILIVVVLLGIAGAVVVPTLGSTDALRIQAAVRTIVADITFAQSDGLARQQSRALVFDVDNNHYAILEVRGPTLDPALDTIRQVNLNERRRFHDAQLDSASFDGNHILVFDSMGGPVLEPGSTVPGNGGSIVISGSGSTFEIQIEAYTGRVNVVRLGP